MKVQINHDNETLTGALGFNSNHLAEVVAKSVDNFLDSDGKSLSKLSEQLQEDLSDEVLLFLATQHVIDSMIKFEEHVMKHFIDHLKKNN